MTRDDSRPSASCGCGALLTYAVDRDWPDLIERGKEHAEVCGLKGAHQ